MVGRRVGSAVEVNESIAGGVPERMAEGTAALVPDGALVEGNRFDSGGGGGTPAEKGAEGKEEREKEGCEECGEHRAQQKEYFHFIWVHFPGLRR